MLADGLRRRPGVRPSVGIVEAGVAQCPNPGWRGQQRVIGAQIVGKVLPAFDQARGHVEPRQVFGRFHQQ